MHKTGKHASSQKRMKQRDEKRSRSRSSRSRRDTTSSISDGDVSQSIASGPALLNYSPSSSRHSRHQRAQSCSVAHTWSRSDQESDESFTHAEENPSRAKLWKHSSGDSITDRSKSFNRHAKYDESTSFQSEEDVRMDISECTQTNETTMPHRNLLGSSAQAVLSEDVVPRAKSMGLPPAPSYLAPDPPSSRVVSVPPDGASPAHDSGTISQVVASRMKRGELISNMSDIHEQVNPETDAQKIPRLRTVLFQAIAQNSRKLAFIGETLCGVTSLDGDYLGSDQRVMCSLLLEIKEILKPFPRVTGAQLEEYVAEGGSLWRAWNSSIPSASRLECFVRNFALLVRNTFERLKAIEIFVSESNNIHSLLTVAVTVRDITKHLKVVNTRGHRPINLPAGHGSTSPSLVLPPMPAGAGPRPQSRVVDMVAFYAQFMTPEESPLIPRRQTESSLLRPAPTRERLGSIPSDRANRPGRAPRGARRRLYTPNRKSSLSSDSSGESPGSASKDSSDNISTDVDSLTEEAKKQMENTLRQKFSTISKTRPGLVEKMIESEDIQVEDPKLAVDESIRIRPMRAPTTPAPPSPAAKPPLPTSYPVGRPSSPSEDEDDVIWRQAMFRKQYAGVFGKGWKDQWVVLTSRLIQCFSSETSQIPVRTYNLKDLHSPSWSGAIPIRIEADTGEELGQIVFWAGKKKVVFSNEDKHTMIDWMIVIDTLQQRMGLEKTIFNPMDKHTLLSLCYKQRHAGGEIKSSYDEEWTYKKDGVLSLYTASREEKLTYRWDGEMLIGVDDKSTVKGSGQWDGVVLVWHDNAANGMLRGDSTTFVENRQLREYTNSTETTQVWKWTRHFLASKFGAGEWIVEGDVPEPIVMFLQMMRTSRLSRQVERDWDANM